jgi:hypothetical protein
MGKEVFLSSYTNKKGEEKHSLGISKSFLNSIYSLETDAFEQVLDALAEHIDDDLVLPNEEKIEELLNFLKSYFALDLE